MTSAEFTSKVKPTWCPGCGDYGVLNAVRSACASLGINKNNLVVVSGIGCSSDLPHFVDAYGLHTLHGRALAVAQGVKMANKALTVLVTGGDGDGYGIGVGHLVHAFRRNVDVTYIIMNNQIYGLTTGQTSPTSTKGVKTKSTPAGSVENALNPLALGIVGGAGFVARAFSGDPAHLAETVRRAVAHKGFSLVDVFSPCVTFNTTNTFPWFRERIVKLEDEKHDPSDMSQALRQSLRDDGRLPIGVFFESIRPSFEEEEPALAGQALVDRPLGLTEDRWNSLLEDFI
jgi:2-oxoglutarate/2-oxoacid ferredoxin oxidoreductase subunit beta